MKSKKSFFNASLFRKNITGCWPLWALASFFGCVLLISTFSYYGTPTNEETLEILNTLLSVLPAYMCGISGASAIIVWHYLNSGKHVCMLHSMPVTRGTLFVTNIISAFVICLIPCVAVLALFTVAYIPFGIPVIAILSALEVAALEWFIFFGIATFCAMICGSTALMIILYVIFNMLAGVTEWLAEMYAEGLLFGVKGDWLNLDFFMPASNLIFASTLTCDGYTDSGMIIGAIKVEGMLTVLIYAAIGTAILLISYFLYRARRSEAAGDAIAVKAFRPIFKYGLAVYSALADGIILYWMMFSGFETSKIEPAQIVICMAVSGFIGYFGAEMLLKKKFKVFTGRAFIGAAAVVIFCAALCFGLDADPMGLTTKVPEVTEIKQLSAEINEKSYVLLAEEEEGLTLFTELHRTVAENRDEYEARDYDLLEYNEINYVTLRYKLKDDSTIEREYRICLSDGCTAGQMIDKISEKISPVDNQNFNDVWDEFGSLTY